MPKSTRLVRLLSTLSSREFTIAELAERFGVSSRTIYRDLASLERDLRAPVTTGDHGYRLLEGATLRPLNLTAEERAVLQLALSNPALRRQTTMAKALERVVDKLHAVTDLMEEGREAMLAGPERTGEVPREVSRALESGSRDRITIEIDYTSLTTPGTRTRLLDPYGLFHRQGVWYCAGHCHVNDEMRIFRLDRIAAARLTERTFEPREVDLEAYLADSWNVYRGTERYQVRLEIDPELAPLFERGSLHEDDELVERDDGGYEYRVTLSHLDEIARYVVGFGGRVKVLEPEGLRRRVGEIARGALESVEDSSD